MQGSSLKISESESIELCLHWKVTAWTDDTSPPAPANSESEEIQAYEDMIALKKVATSDITHGLVRYD